MSEGTLKEELGGLKDRAVGAVKEAAGSLTNDRSLENEGEAQNAYGNARQENNDVVTDDNSGDGTVKEEAAGLKDRIVGNIKDAAGYVTGNEELQEEGKAQAEYGKARQENNDVV